MEESTDLVETWADLIWFCLDDLDMRMTEMTINDIQFIQ